MKATGAVLALLLVSAIPLLAHLNPGLAGTWTLDPYRLSAARADEKSGVVRDIPTAAEGER